MYKFSWKGKEYLIQTDEGEKRDKQILRDFNHCLEIRDYGTIKNRITNGTMWGWLKKVEKEEEVFWKPKKED
jgi:hypothetical protein